MNTNSDIPENKLPAGHNLCGEAASDFHPMSPFPEDRHQHISHESGMALFLTLRSLGNSLPSERALVANALIEVARQINETIPANTENQSNY